MPNQISPTGRILVGADGSPASVAAVRWAAREAQLRGMRVHVVFVQDKRVPIPHYAPHPRGADADLGPAAAESTLKALVGEALGAQPAGTQAEAVQMAAVQMELADGPPARVLLERSVGAEMLVLGSTRPGGGPSGTAGAAALATQSRRSLGPVARDCLNAAACPVVVVRSSDARPAAQPVHA
jgi:nucleotide-binding universal stress UspA family protein